MTQSQRVISPLLWAALIAAAFLAAGFVSGSSGLNPRVRKLEAQVRKLSKRMDALEARQACFKDTLGAGVVDARDANGYPYSALERSTLAQYRLVLTNCQP